jgi:hypothetical protein
MYKNKDLTAFWRVLYVAMIIVDNQDRSSSVAREDADLNQFDGTSSMPK